MSCEKAFLDGKKVVTIDNRPARILEVSDEKVRWKFLDRPTDKVADTGPEQSEFEATFAELGNRLVALDLTNRRVVSGRFRVIFDVGDLLGMDRDKEIFEFEKQLEKLGWSKTEVIKMRDEGARWSKFGRVGIPFMRRKGQRKKGYRY